MVVRKIKLMCHLWHNLESYRFGEIRGSGRCHFWTPYWVINLIRFTDCKNTGRSNSGWVTLTQLPSLSLVSFLLLVLASYARHIPNIFQAYARHTPSIFQAYAKHMPSIFQPYSKHMPSICQAYSKHMPSVMHSLGTVTIFLGFSCCRAVPDWVCIEYEPYGKHMPSTCQAYSKYIPSTCQA